MVKHTQTIRWQQPTNCLIVFDHFVGLVLKELKISCFFFIVRTATPRWLRLITSVMMKFPSFNNTNYILQQKNLINRQ